MNKLNKSIKANILGLWVIEMIERASYSLQSECHNFNKLLMNSNDVSVDIVLMWGILNW